MPPPSDSQSPAGKKRRPNFRPMSRGKVPTASANASIAKQAAAKSSSIPVQATTELPDQPVNAKDAGPPTTEKALPASQVNEDRRKAAEEQPTPETNKEPPVASTTKPTSTTRAESSAFTPQSSAKKNRKRKKLGVPVAASRLSIEEPLLSEVATPAAAGTDALDPSITAASPATESGQPSLASYCSSFRGKRTKRDKTAPPKKVTKETLPVIAQTDDSAAANQSDVATAPQVQVINGEIVLNESSIVVAGTTPAGSARDTEDLVVVEEEAQIAVVGASYNSFVSRRAPQHWTVEETELFYDALRQVGTDFGTMEAYFNKKRTRKQLKRKFQIESTKNPHLIEHALNPKAMKEIDMSVFKVDENDLAELTASKLSEAENLNKVSTNVTVQSETVSEGTSTSKASAKTTRGKRSASNKKSTTNPTAEELLLGPDDAPAPTTAQPEGEPIVEDALLMHDDVAEVSFAPIVKASKRRATKPNFRARTKASTPRG